MKVHCLSRDSTPRVLVSVGNLQELADPTGLKPQWFGCGYGKDELPARCAERIAGRSTGRLVLETS